MADVKLAEEQQQNSCPEKRKLESQKPELESNADDSVTKKLKIDEEIKKNGNSETVAALINQSNNDVIDDDDDEEDYVGEEEYEEEVVAPVDRKGKGIMIEEDRKGKGKMIEWDEDDDSDDGGSDDSSDGDDSDEFEFGDESEEEEVDPLAEVDLDNILPSRTRRGRAQPGVRICDDRDKARD